MVIMKVTKINSLHLIGEDYEISCDPDFLTWTVQERDNFAIDFLTKNKLTIREVCYAVPHYCLDYYLPTSISIVTTDYKNKVYKD